MNPASGFPNQLHLYTNEDCWGDKKDYNDKVFEISQVYMYYENQYKRKSGNYVKLNK